MPTCSSPRTTACRPRIAPVAPPPHKLQEATAQRTACDFLIRSCERALFDLRCALGEATDPQEVRAGLRAIELLQEVLDGWRETRAVVAAAESQPVRQRLRHVHGR